MSYSYNHTTCTLFRFVSFTCLGFPGGTSSKQPTCQCRRNMRCRFSPWVRKILWRRKWQPTPVIFAWRPKGREPRGLQSTGLQRVRHDWSDLAHTQAARTPFTQRYAFKVPPCLHGLIAHFKHWIIFHCLDVVNHSLFIPWRASGCSQLLTIINKAVINIHINMNKHTHVDFCVDISTHLSK